MVVVDVVVIIIVVMRVMGDRRRVECIVFFVHVLMGIRCVGACVGAGDVVFD